MGGQEVETACGLGRKVVLRGEAGEGQRGLFGMTVPLGNCAHAATSPSVSSFSKCLSHYDASVLCDHVLGGRGRGESIVINVS